METADDGSDNDRDDSVHEDNDDNGDGTPCISSTK